MQQQRTKTGWIIKVVLYFALMQVSTQVSEAPPLSMRRGAMLDLVLPNKDGLMGNVKLKDSLGCSDHEIMELKIFALLRRT